MNKIIISAIAALAIGTSAMAFDLIGEDENVFIQFGGDTFGDTNDAEDIKWSSTGNPCGPGTCGKYGTDTDIGYEITIGLEKNVKDGEFGSRKIVTFYNHGDSQFHNGSYVSDISNMGLELSYEVFYKVNNYFKPSIGAGFGVNQREYTTAATASNGTAYRDETNYEPTGHLSIGVTGEIYSGLGWYVNYKYRFADKSTTQIPTKHYEGGISGALRPVKWIPFEQEGVNGDQLMLGLSYKF